MANLREQVDVHDRTVCTAIRSGNRDCDEPIPPDAPVSLCWGHLIKAHLFIRDKLGEPPIMAPLILREFHPQYVYYVRFGDRVKIGTTTDVAQRLMAIPHDEILAVEPGGVQLERERHNQFARHHIKGEWFTADPELMAHAYRVSLAHPELVPS